MTSSVPEKRAVETLILLDFASGPLLKESRSRPTTRASSSNVKPAASARWVSHASCCSAVTWATTLPRVPCAPALEDTGFASLTLHQGILESTVIGRLRRPCVPSSLFHDVRGIRGLGTDDVEDVFIPLRIGAPQDTGITRVDVRGECGADRCVHRLRIGQQFPAAPLPRIEVDAGEGAHAEITVSKKGSTEVPMSLANRQPSVSRTTVRHDTGTSWRANPPDSPGRPSL